MPQNTFDDESTLVQVMAWCRQATSHYLNQCWPRSILPYGVTRPQWVNLTLSSAQLPVKFKSNEPGHYPCRIVLTSLDDIRVYHIECTVAPQGSEAQLEFSAPTHQAITQDIPVVSHPHYLTLVMLNFSGKKNVFFIFIYFLILRWCR